MKVFELIGVFVMIAIVIGVLYVQAQTNDAQIREIAYDFQNQLTILQNQSYSNITKISSEFQTLLAQKQSELDAKSSQITSNEISIGDKNTQITTLSEQITTLQTKYNGLNGTITTRIIDELKNTSFSFRNFTVKYLHGVLNISEGKALLDDGIINFIDARSYVNSTNQTVANQTIANSAKTNFTNSNNIFTLTNTSFIKCKNLVFNTNLTDFIDHYNVALFYAQNMTYEMIQACSNITNTTNVLHHWSLYNNTANLFDNKLIAIDNHIADWV